jgi:hypothetical protein
VYIYNIYNDDVVPLEISPDETLSGLIAKVKKLMGSEFPIRLFWDGTYAPGQPYKGMPELQHQVRWENAIDGPRIKLSWETPAAVKKLTGVTETEKSTLVSREVFDRLEIAKVCDLRFYPGIGVMFLKPFTSPA